jgi:hypothetical protein
VSVSESSANTCPPPKAAAYSASATDATTTGIRWQKAWRGALWVVVIGSGWEGCDWMRREARTRDCLALRLCLRLSGGGLRRYGGGSPSPTEHPATLPDLGRDR